MRNHSITALAFFRAAAVLLLLAPIARAADPLTDAKLSAHLTENCTKLRDEFKKAPPPALPADTCKQAGDTPTDDELAACRATLAKISTDAFEDVRTLMGTQHTAVRALISGNSKAIQRLHVVLAGRADELGQVVSDAAAKAWEDFAPPDATTKLAAAATAEKLAAVETSIGDELFEACLAADASIIEAAFPTPLTPAEEAASTVRVAQQVLSDAERDAFAEFSKATGFARSVECLWGTKAENGARRAVLACKPGLLVSGEEVSEIRVLGVPAGVKVKVIAMHAEELRQAAKCPPGDGADNLTCDELTIPAASPQPISIGVHTMRAVNPTWGGFWGTVKNAKQILRPKNVRRTKLSLVNEGTPPTIAIGVTAGSEFAAAYIPVGYARWKIESGGFLSVSDQVDHEVVSTPVTGTTTVKVSKIRDSDSVVQDSGIFVNFIPQNYQSVGVSLGFATPSNRRLSVYLGPTVRVRTFGNRGLAALAAGMAMRSVLRFPDVSLTDPIPTDSKVLQGREQFRFGWFVGINLGFRIGAFGPQEDTDE